MNPEPQDNINQINNTQQPKPKKTKTTHTMAPKEPIEDEDLVYERVKKSRFKQQNLLNNKIFQLGVLFQQLSV